MEIRLRPLGVPDAIQYRTIRLNALKLAPTAFSSSFETCRLLADEFFLDRATFAPDNFIIGGFHDQNLIATAGGYVDQEKKRNHIGFVVGMWVEPSYRKHGIARKLLHAVVTQLKSLPHVTNIQLSVTDDNHHALELYKNYGFVVWGREPHALKLPDDVYDELHMALEAWVD